MKKINILLTVLIMVIGVSVSAHGTLVDMHDGTIYDTDTELSWLKDVQAGGGKSWEDAIAWAASLNSNGGFAGLTGWRLPASDPECNENVLAYNCTNSEMGHLYYTELGGVAGGPLTNTGPFTNLSTATASHWSGTEYESNNSLAWFFDFYNHGYQSRASKVVIFYAWAVRPGARSQPQNLFANVSQSGTLISGNGVSGVSKLGTGRYEVTFTSAVSACAYVATTVNAYSQALTVFTASGHNSANGVYVETKNQGGGLTDGPFNLIVNCGTPGMQYAVVGYTKDLARATPGTTLTSLGVGRYKVTFPSPVNKCAFLATVGDPGNQLVYNPAGVYTASRWNNDAVYVETKNPGGGLSNGIPFHLSVICPSAARTHIAVIKETGLIARGSALTSAFKTSTGQFTVVTKEIIDPTCSTVATRGAVDKAVPYAPATVELVAGPAGNTIGVEMRELLFFGGALTDQAFHAATVCP